MSITPPRIRAARIHETRRAYADRAVSAAGNDYQIGD